MPVQKKSLEAYWLHHISYGYPVSIPKLSEIVPRASTFNAISASFVIHNFFSILHFDQIIFLYFFLFAILFYWNYEVDWEVLFLLIKITDTIGEKS